MTKLEKVKNRIIELVPEIETTKPTKEDKREAVMFIKKNPNKEKYISENFRQFMNGEEPDDNSVELCEEWEEMESLSKHKIVKSCRPITLVDVLIALERNRKLCKERFFVSSKGYLERATPKGTIFETQEQVIWQFNKPLDDQSEEVINFLEETLNG